MNLLYGILILAAAAAASWPLGRYLAWSLQPVGPNRLDRLIGRALGRGALIEGDWKRYALALLGVNALFFGVSFIFLIFQGNLPLNPDGKAGLPLDLAFHTAVSFTTNTNLQHYSGEQALSYFSQLFSLTWLQFVSAATGIAALAAVARLLVGQPAGAFLRDAFRVTVLVLLPASLLVATILLFSGMPMTFEGAAVAQALEGGVQTIARGPVAAMVAIKQLGTNGGGYFGPNSTHPFENPTFFTGVVELFAIIVIPMACVWMFGRMVNRVRHAGVIFGVMALLVVGIGGVAVAMEAEPNPALAGLSVDQSLGNLEGKELRFGPANGPWWAVVTTETSNGSVSAMHDSLNPLTGLMPLIGMWLNVGFGGVGVGLINMLLYIFVAVFIAGLMVGRTPEYFGRKVEVREMKGVALALLLHPLLILGGTAWFASTSLGTATVSNPGSHGFSQILYEFSSAAANNGSGFEGLGDNTVAWNLATGLVMLLGRYIPIVVPLAIAGSLGVKRVAPETAGTLRTDTLLFGLLLLGCVVLLGALLFLPAAVLGPIAESLGADSLGGA
jgi:K+-transporting ATPase ATPase A chain